MMETCLQNIDAIGIVVEAWNESSRIAAPLELTTLSKRH